MALCPLLKFGCTLWPIRQVQKHRDSSFITPNYLPSGGRGLAEDWDCHWITICLSFPRRFKARPKLWMFTERTQGWRNITKMIDSNNRPSGIPRWTWWLQRPFNCTNAPVSMSITALPELTSRITRGRASGVNRKFCSGYRGGNRLSPRSPFSQWESLHFGSQCQSSEELAFEDMDYW